MTMTTTMTRPVATTAERFNALDCVRASAMLLGVVFHAVQFGGMMGGGGPIGPGGASQWFTEFLHSFRMPLFFLITGFFCRMMLEKYGTRRYLLKRWTRIGLPLVIGLFTIIPLYQLTRMGMGGPPGGGGPIGPPPGFAGRGPGPGGMPGPGPGGGFASMPPPPPGFVPPPFRRFDADGDGSLSETEWAKVREDMEKSGGPGGGFPFPPGGSGGFGPPGGGSGLGDRIFGPAARLFRLDYLWFLWYLLVFATVGPWVATALDWALLRRTSDTADGLSRRVLKFGIAPLVLGLVSTPLLMMTAMFFGWSLGVAAGVFRGVPDFLFHLEPDMPFYFAYFLAGWWLHRERESLPDVARIWLPCLIVGVVAHAAAAGLSARYAPQTGLPHYGLIKFGGFTVYSLGSAFTAFGFLGFFQRYVNHPNRVGRYLADTAFWVYMVHQPLLTPFLSWVSRLGLPWWAQGAIVSLLTTASALVLFELVVRPTPLYRLFGPSPPRRNTPGGPEAGAGESVTGLTVPI